VPEPAGFGSVGGEGEVAQDAGVVQGGGPVGEGGRGGPVPVGMVQAEPHPQVGFGYAVTDEPPVVGGPIDPAGQQVGQVAVLSCPVGDRLRDLGAS
jgi:hypothetical protein